MKNKKITFLISSLAGGGAEGVCVNIANALAKDDWQVDLVVLNLKNAAYKERVSSKINLVNLNVSNARYSVGTQRIWPPRALTLGHLTHNDLATVRISK